MRRMGKGGTVGHSGETPSTAAEFLNTTGSLTKAKKTYLEENYNLSNKGQLMSSNRKERKALLEREKAFEELLDRKRKEEEEAAAAAAKANCDDDVDVDVGENVFKKSAAAKGGSKAKKKPGVDAEASLMEFQQRALEQERRKKEAAAEKRREEERLQRERLEREEAEKHAIDVARARKACLTAMEKRIRKACLRKAMCGFVLVFQEKKYTKALVSGFRRKSARRMWIKIWREHVRDVSHARKAVLSVCREEWLDVMFAWHKLASEGDRARSRHSFSAYGNPAAQNLVERFALENHSASAPESSARSISNISTQSQFSLSAASTQYSQHSQYVVSEWSAPEADTDGLWSSTTTTTEPSLQLDGDDGLCAICFDLKIDSVLIPCNHGFCSVCVARLKKQAVYQATEGVLCPLCRTPVKKFVLQRSASSVSASLPTLPAWQSHTAKSQEGPDKNQAVNSSKVLESIVASASSHIEGRPSASSLHLGANVPFAAQEQTQKSANGQTLRNNLWGPDALSLGGHTQESVYGQTCNSSPWEASGRRPAQTLGYDESSSQLLPNALPLHLSHEPLHPSHESLYPSYDEPLPPQHQLEQLLEHELEQMLRLQERHQQQQEQHQQQDLLSQQIAQNQRLRALNAEKVALEQIAQNEHQISLNAQLIAQHHSKNHANELLSKGMQRIQDGHAFAAQGLAAQAAVCFEEALSLHVSVLGLGHPLTTQAAYELGMFQFNVGAFNQAAQVLSAAIDSAVTAGTQGAAASCMCMYIAGLALTELGVKARALAMLEKAAQGFECLYGKDDEMFQTVHRVILDAL